MSSYNVLIFIPPSVPLLFLLFFIPFSTNAQQSWISGTITDSKSHKPVSNVNILSSSGIGSISDQNGYYKFTIPSNKKFILTFSHQSYRKKISDTLFVLSEKELLLNVSLVEESKKLPEVEVHDTRKIPDNVREQAGVTKVDPKIIKTLPSVFGDFSKVITTLPGVATRDELATTYSVRGGNFDENLVYVNGIDIYRPFLTRSSQQEGLSFVNPDLVSDIEFSAGGFQAKYGDKMSSVLSIEYKKPRKFAGSVSAGLLGGTAHVEGVSKNKKNSYLIGIRQKSAEDILGTQETKGEYKPSFTDIQTFVNFNLSSDTVFTENKKTDYIRSSDLGLLGAYSRNRYHVIPTTQETSFGTLMRVFRLFVAFDGQEVDQFDTWQGGLIFTRRASRDFSYTLTASGMYSGESETYDIEGGYRLCDVSTSLGNDEFNKCVFERGIGTFFNHARNFLNAQVYSLDYKGFYSSNRNKWVYGIRSSFENINDEISEWTFVDSADYVQFHDYVNTNLTLTSKRYSGFIQDSYQFDSLKLLTIGIRSSFWDANQDITLSPRLQFSWKPLWFRKDSTQRDVVFRTAIGFYHQPPFYRELRDRNGVINNNVKSQTSVHFLLGTDSNFKMWGRPFKLFTEAYYKYMYNIIPYDVDNIRIRYFANNKAKAYAAGFDFRINGEFVKGVDSWFSLGLLRTEENLEGDYDLNATLDVNTGDTLVVTRQEKGYIPRPTDQLFTASVFFQDYFPRNRTIKMYLNFIFATGVPFGPPNSMKWRSSFTSKPYWRADIGFSKLLIFNEKRTFHSRHLESLWAGLEVLNLLQAANTGSYIWIEDIYGTQFAVPNRLTNRLVNVRVIVKF